jgi:hypothetical protein
MTTCRRSPKRSAVCSSPGDTDFGEIVFRQGRASAGVLLLRLAGLAPDRKASIVSEVIAAHVLELKTAFSVVTPGQVRIRRP